MEKRIKTSQETGTTTHVLRRPHVSNVKGLNANDKVFLHIAWVLSCNFQKRREIYKKDVITQIKRTVAVEGGGTESEREREGERKRTGMGRGGV